MAEKSGSVVTGPSAAHPALLELQRDLLWAGLRTTLNEEAQVPQHADSLSFRCCALFPMIRSLGHSPPGSIT